MGYNHSNGEGGASGHCHIPNHASGAMSSMIRSAKVFMDWTKAALKGYILRPATVLGA